MSTTAVAELTGIRQFSVLERRVEDPGPGEVQVRVAAVGVCGSDLHSYSEGSVGDQTCKYPMVLGHEPSGVVVRVGAGVTGWAPGDEAALEPAMYCYHCEFCTSGHHNVCANIRFMSSTEDAGFFRERLNVPARNLLPLRGGIGLREATLIEPMAIVLHSLKFVAPQLGDDVVVFGAGPIGLLTVAALRLAGVARIFAVEPVAHRREMALALGADAAMDPSNSDVAHEIRGETGGRGVDVAYDCAAKGETTNQAMASVRNRGAVILTGIHSEVRFGFNPHVMRRKEVALYCVRRSNHESELALETLARHAKLFAPVITHERPMSQIGAAFDMVEHYGDGAGKVLITP